MQWPIKTARLAVERLAKGDDLSAGQQRQAGQTDGLTMLTALLVGGIAGLGRRWSVAERDRNHAISALGEGHSGGELQETLGTHEVGLKRRAEGVAAPGYAGSAGPGFVEQRVIDSDAQGSVWRELIDDGATHHGEEVVDGEAVLTEDPVGSGPVLELAPAGGQQAGHGVAPQAEEAA
jgi:hypothetical protein